MEIEIQDGMDIVIVDTKLIDPETGPMTSTYRDLIDARQSLEYAEDAVRNLRYEPRATPAMYDSLYQSIATWTDRVRRLQAQSDAEFDAWYAMANEPTGEPETVTINGEAFAVVALNIDCPGDVTHRDVERRQRGETFGDTIARLLAKATIEGLQLPPPPGDDPYFYCRSSANPSTLYRINPETLHCTCPASGLCKHLAMVSVLTEQIDRLSALYRHRPAA